MEDHVGPIAQRRNIMSGLRLWEGGQQRKAWLPTSHRKHYLTGTTK